jgi:Short C-terminal domain
MRLVPRQSQIPLYNMSPTQAPPPPVVVVQASATDQALEELRKLGELKAQGVLTDAEFATMKARILAD